MGTAGQTICTASLTAGGGAASCSGYSDFDTGVSFPPSISDGVHVQWTGVAPLTFIDTTGGNTHTVSYYLQYSGLTFTANPSAPSTWDSNLNIPVMGTSLGVSGTLCTISASAGGGLASCSSLIDAGTSVSFSNPISDGANARWDTGMAMFTPGAGSTTTANYYLQLQNTYQATPNAQVTWDGGLASQAAVGTLLGIGSSTICTITLTGGGGAQTCTGWADYNLPVLIGTPTIAGAPANSQWLRSTACSFTQTTGGNTNNCDYYKQYTNNFAYSVTDGGSPTAPTLTCTQLGSNVSCGTLSTSNTAIWVDSGGSYSATNPTTGSTGSERWDSSAPSGTITSGGSSITVAYYHQYLQTLSYSVSGGGSPAPPIASGLQFGSAYAPTLTGAPTGYWFDSSGSVTFTNPISGAANERWDSAVSSISATSSATTALTYYHQYQNTYSFSPAVPATWDNGFSPVITGTELGTSGTHRVHRHSHVWGWSSVVYGIL